MDDTLGQRIRRARDRQGLTQASLAKKLGVTQGAVAAWERGTSPTGVNLGNLKQVLGGLNMPSTTSDPSDEVSSFGIWLRNERMNADLSVPELAAKSGLSAPAIYNIESGKIQNPQIGTRDSISKALAKHVPTDVVHETESVQSIEGLGNLTDFVPYDQKDLPNVAGVYVLYDVSDRPVYVGKAELISRRISQHSNMFWFKPPIVVNGSFIEVSDKYLRHQLEQVLIKFLKSNAVINKQSVEQFPGDGG